MLNILKRCVKLTKELDEARDQFVRLTLKLLVAFVLQLWQYPSRWTLPSLGLGVCKGRRSKFGEGAAF